MSILHLNRQTLVHGPPGISLLVIVEPPRIGRSALLRLEREPDPPHRYAFRPATRNHSEVWIKKRRCEAHRIADDGVYLAETRDEDDGPAHRVFVYDRGHVRFVDPNSSLEFLPAKLLRPISRSQPEPDSDRDSSDRRPRQEDDRDLAKIQAKSVVPKSKAKAKNDLPAVMPQAKPGSLAWRIRERMSERALANGCRGASELIRSIRDPSWFLSHRGKSFDQLPWPRADQVDFAWLARDFDPAVEETPPKLKLKDLSDS